MLERDICAHSQPHNFQAAVEWSLWFQPGCLHVPREWGFDAPQHQDGQARGHPVAQGAVAGTGGCRGGQAVVFRDHAVLE